MKPKISTGYLTPQAKKKKQRGRLSDTEENASEPGIDENIFAALMKCPEKKKMVLELLAANKHAIKQYKENGSKNSPLAKVKNKKRACESPTALLRRRALEQMNTSPSTTTTNRSSSTRSELSRSSSRCSEVSSDHSSSSVPFDKVLDGVVAFVEIKNKDQDRSSGAKAILKSMGAKVREKFTNDVTHIIFKDGSFMTYQKSKLMKIHLVSILWVEFCRKTMRRQPEKQYPALNSGFQDNETSMICSQMQKEYEDIIRDEYRKSIKDGTPLPSTRSLINRRRTLMTPSVSNLNSSSTSFHTAADELSSQERSDREAINGFNSVDQDVDEESLILNDPDCFSEVSGPMVNGSTVEKRDKRNSVSKCILKCAENVDIGLAEINASTSFRSSNASQQQKSIIESDMELTMLLSSNKTPKAKASINDIHGQKTPKLPSQKIPTNLFDRRNTICNSFLSSDTSTADVTPSDKSKTPTSLLSSDKSTNISGNISFAVPKSVRKSKRSSSSLFGSNESLVFGKNKAKSSKISRVELDKTASAMSELNLSSKKDISKRCSVLLSLHTSLEGKETEKSKSSTGRSNSMSRLWLSSERKSNNEIPERSTSMSDLHLSSETSNKNKERLIVETSLVNKSSIPISSKDNKNSADKSSMSTLQISSESKKFSGRNSSKDNRNNTLNSDPSMMSSLYISSDKMPPNSLRHSKEKENPSTNTSFSSIDTGSFKNLVQTVIEKLNTPDSVTARKSDQSSASLSRASIDSDVSEILPPRNMRSRRTIGESINLEDSICTSADNLSKQGEIELPSTVTKRKKSLGPRKSLFQTQKESPIDKDKILVVNIIKSPLKNLQSDKDSSESTKSASLNRPRRRTLGEGLKNPDVVEDSNNQNNNSNKKSKNSKKRASAQTKDNSRQIPSDTSTESDIDRSSTSKTKSDDSSDSTTSRKKLRRLYNPDDSIPVLVDDEQERREKRLEMRTRKSKDGVFINPAEVLKTSEKRLKQISLSESIESECSDADESPLKPTKKGNRKNLKVASLNSSADEQKELLNEVINKKNKTEVIPKTPKTPRSLTKTKSKVKDKTPKVHITAETPSRRKSIRIIKPTQKLNDSQKRVAKNDVAITPRNRRSTLDFQPISSNKKPKKVDKVKLPTIVCTKLHKSDVQMFTQIIRKLGRFVVEDEVTSRTTHLVAGESKRTINMLRAVSRGCWVLKFDWVLQSLEAGKWLREEDFEVHDFSPAVQKCRLERQAFGPTYAVDVFENCPPIYVASSTNPRCSDLKELITTCRGKVVTAPRMAKIIVGDVLVQDDTVCVNETWVLDCITFNKRMALKKQYLLEKENNSKRKSVAV